MTLGTSGDSFDVVISETEGLLSPEGRPLARSGRVTAANGSTYALALQAASVVATYVPQIQSVQLPDSGSVSLTSIEDGSWRLGSIRSVQNGHVVVRAGKSYVLELYFGRWRLARYIIRSAAGSTAVADGVHAASASLNDVYGLAVDSVGNLFIADGGDQTSPQDRFLRHYNHRPPNFELHFGDGDRPVGQPVCRSRELYCKSRCSRRLGRDDSGNWQARIRR